MSPHVTSYGRKANSIASKPQPARLVGQLRRVHIRGPLRVVVVHEDHGLMASQQPLPEAFQAEHLTAGGDHRVQLQVVVELRDVVRHVQVKLLRDHVLIARIAVESVLNPFDS